MKKPVVDYRKFRFSRLNDPEFSHLKLLGSWIVYFVFYYLTENLIPESSCHPMHCFLDDLIPFREEFVIFYAGWYVLIVFSLLYFALYNVESFRNLSKYIIITQVVAMAAYILYPTRQDLRPAVFPRENFFSWIMGIIYSVDTNTGVCPSLHVAYSMGIGSVWVREKDVKPVWKVLMVILVILISLSTAFVKQHSFVDIFFGVLLGIFADLIIFRKEYASLLRKKKPQA